MLISFNRDDTVSSDVRGIYIDSNNASKVRVFVGGNLIGVSTTFKYDEDYKIFRVHLFKHHFSIPMSATNCSPLFIHVSPKDPDVPAPKIWLEVEDTSAYTNLQQEREFMFILMDGQLGKLVASQHKRDRFLSCWTRIEDNSFATEQEARMEDIASSYRVAFNTNDSMFVQFFASGFAKSLPYINPSDAATMALAHEKKPLMECLRAIWRDYQNTSAYKKTLTL
jgi:hypothetical protein